MSYYSDASLVYIPAAVKNGKTYSIKPTDGTGDLTFTRASNATRIGPNGLLEKVRTNVLLQSNTFSTTWSPISVSLTGGQTGYDGTNNAWLIDIIAGTSSQRVNQTISASGVLTLSVYAKAGTLNWISLRGDAPAVSEAYFNLATGALGSLVGAAIDSSIESVGSGWYRCSVSFVNTTIVRIYLASGDNNVSQSSGNVYLQDAQLEAGDIATDYIATTSAAVSVGPVSGLPRLDYLNSSCPRLLLEPQRTNVVLSSEDWTTNWSGANRLVTANEIVSPDGYQNADKLSATGGGSYYSQVRTTASGANTFSVFLKYGSKTTQSIYAYSSSTYFAQASFNLQTGEVSSISSGTAKIEDYGNGWYRCSVSGTAGDSTIEVGIESIAVGAFTYAWGAQLEAGAYATSYIPTLGTSVTRVADAASKTGISSLIGQTEGTFYAELEVIGGITSAAFYARNPSGGNYGEFMALYFNGDKYPTFEVRTGNTEQAFIRQSTAYPSGIHKIAGAYKANDFVLYVDGVQVGSDTSGSIPALSELYLGAYVDGGVRNHTKKQALVFKTRLTNAQLAELTA